MCISTLRSALQLWGILHFSIVSPLNGGYSDNLEDLWAVHVSEPKGLPCRPKTCPGTSGHFNIVSPLNGRYSVDLGVYVYMYICVYVHRSPQKMKGEPCICVYVH